MIFQNIVAFLFIIKLESSHCEDWESDPRVVNRGKWPSKPEYLTFTISNLDEYLTPFNSCFVHIINFEYLDLPKISVPIALSRYDFVLRNLAPNGSTAEKFYVKFPVGKKLPERIDEYKYYDGYKDYSRPETKSHKYRGWICSVQLYSFPPGNQPNTKDPMKVKLIVCTTNELRVHINLTQLNRRLKFNSYHKSRLAFFQSDVFI